MPANLILECRFALDIIIIIAKIVCINNAVLSSQFRKGTWLILLILEMLLTRINVIDQRLKSVPNNVALVTSEEVE